MYLSGNRPKCFITVLILIYISWVTCWTQPTDSIQKNYLFLETESRIGWVVPNHSNFPPSTASHGYHLSFGYLNASEQKNWASFYNYPYTGVTASFTNLGNDSIFGNQYTLMPFIAFNTANRLYNAVNFRIGLGCSYFTRHYQRPDNRMNRAIGSHFTWSFQALMYYSVFTSTYFSLQVGAGFQHSSNGHTQLPNIGLNHGIICFAGQFYPLGVNRQFHPKSCRLEVSRNKSYYYMIRNGFGFHEYGNAGGPVGGQKRMVKSMTLSAGILFREHIKVEAGFAGRFYSQYYYHILHPLDSVYGTRPKLNSTCLYFYVGSEFLLGHIGMDIEAGLNIYKPYYEKHYTYLEGEIGTDYWLKRIFNTKLGLNYYIVNTDRNPRINLFFGASINANFGQADFSEACIGIVHTMKH